MNMETSSPSPDDEAFHIDVQSDVLAEVRADHVALHADPTTVSISTSPPIRHISRSVCRHISRSVCTFARASPVVLSS